MQQYFPDHILDGAVHSLGTAVVLRSVACGDENFTAICYQLFYLSEIFLSATKNDLLHPTVGMPLNPANILSHQLGSLVFRL